MTSAPKYNQEPSGGTPVTGINTPPVLGDPPLNAGANPPQQFTPKQSDPQSADNSLNSQTSVAQEDPMNTGAAGIPSGTDEASKSQGDISPLLELSSKLDSLKSEFDDEVEANPTKIGSDLSDIAKQAQTEGVGTEGFSSEQASESSASVVNPALPGGSQDNSPVQSASVQQGGALSQPTDVSGSDTVADTDVSVGTVGTGGAESGSSENVVNSFDPLQAIATSSNPNGSDLQQNQPDWQGQQSSTTVQDPLKAVTGIDTQDISQTGVADAGTETAVAQTTDVVSGSAPVAQATGVTAASDPIAQAQVTVANPLDANQSATSQGQTTVQDFSSPVSQPNTGAQSVETASASGSSAAQTSSADVQGLSQPTTVTQDPSLVAPAAVSTGSFPYQIESLLDIVVERNASDMHISDGYPVMIRVDGGLVAVSQDIVTPEVADELILPVLNEQKKELLEVNREVDLAYAHGDDARFRINAYYQQQTLAAAFRLIPNKIKTLDDLNLPQVYNKLTKLRQGLVLVTGPTGSGKSTTLAAILQEINMTRPDHIITIEDPVEYVFPKARSMVDQREMHEDTHSWEIALKSAMRQDPDVVLVGEMRDYETISSAITLAETGHLVFATLHTNSAAQTIDRVIDVFPEAQQEQVRSQLSNTIQAVVAQRLIPLTSGGRRAASEFMVATPAVRNLIREGKTHQLDNVIRTSADIGMVSLEHSLVKLVRENLITMEKAQEFAVHPEEVVRLLKK